MRLQHTIDGIARTHKVAAGMYYKTEAGIIYFLNHKATDLGPNTKKQIIALCDPDGRIWRGIKQER